MITAQEASRSIYGAWRLARFDANGVSFFDNTVEAFWRSFWAAAIALPAYAVLLVLGTAGVTVGVGPVHTFLVYSIAYVIDWLAFPFVMFYVAHLFDRQQWYCRYIVAYNWALVLQMLLQLIVSSVAASGILPPGAEALLKVAAFFYILAFQGFIAHVALQATLPGAVGCVVAGFFLSFMLIQWSDRLLQIQRVVGG